MKKIITFLLLFAIGLIIPIGCSNNPNTSDTTSNNLLNIYNWSTYIAPEVITEFENKFNVKIQYDTYESNEDLYAKIKPGNPGYDVAFPADYMVRIMAAEGLLEELNQENIPNIKNLTPKFLNPPYDPGNKYSVAYQWGTMGIGYNLKATGGEIDSWLTMFDPKFTGRVALLDDMRSSFSLALISLDYNPNTTNPQEINQAKDFLIKNKEAIAAFAPDTGQNLLDQGEVDLTCEWSGDVFQVMKENPNLRYAIPKEGSILLTDNMVILKGTRNKELAEKFINFILEPEIGAKISNFIKYATPNQAAKDQGLIEADDLNNPAIYPPPELFAKLQYIQDLGQATVLYDEAWTEVKLGMGG
ncbi:MAG: spermidine/putrescine ABC transporter substrate-binding protein [Microcoleaceae cyanobacterium MO_207.B10]|nr:spermidine/putrescine ABC transporter substrate-binding protein [Microcoleaceae cyanobacterium MO_207.B10]